MLKDVDLLRFIGRCIVDVLKAVALGVTVSCHFKDSVFCHLQDLDRFLYGFWRLVKRFTRFFQFLKPVCE